MLKRQLIACLCAVGSALPATASNPVASYIFPAGGQRGQTVNVKVGGLFLHQSCGFEMLGSDVSFAKELKRIPTLWLEGPMLPLPDSQRAEDYPKDMAGQIQIAKDAKLGIRNWRLWTSQGATSSMKFVVGDLPEVVEHEIDGDPVPVKVELPVTVNGRIFPREDVDVWTFSAKKGQSVWCEVNAARFGSPLEPRVEIRDSQGRRFMESDDARGPDPRMRFIAPADGEYQVRIFDAQFQGGQAYVYRLTLTSEPVVERFYPLGGKRGTTVSLKVAGQNLPAATIPVAIPATADSAFPFTVASAGMRSNSHLLDVDEFPEFQEGVARALETITAPAVLNGVIAKPGEIDAWVINGKKGESLVCELRAGRLDSPLDGLLTLFDAAGNQLARAEPAGAQLDPVLTATLSADGAYTMKVQDRFRTRGGPEFAYRLRIAPPPAPDFRLVLVGEPRNNLGPDGLTLPRGGQVKLKMGAERIGAFKEPIGIMVEGLPAGVTVAPASIAAGQANVELTFKAEANAKIAPAHLRIIGTVKINGQDVKRIASLQGPRGSSDIDTVLLAVAMPTPFVIKGEYDMGFAARGGVHQRKYKIERNGFDGPIEVSLTDRQARHLQGVTGPTITVPTGINEFTYTALLPPWMETGRTSRTCVMGVGVVKDKDGSEHRVCFSSVNQNEQLVAVVGPGQLAMELERTSCAVTPGQIAAIPVRVKRGLTLKGTVKLELITPSHIQGVAAEPINIAADQERGQLLLRFTGKAEGPFNMPLTIRATVMRDNQPVIAEQLLDVRP